MAIFVLPLALAVAIGSAGVVRAQTSSPTAPMPQPMPPPMPQPMPAPGPGSPGTTVTPEQKCLQEFTGYRTEVETRARAAADESKKRPTRARMCELVSDYATAELAWLRFAEANMAECGIPPQLIEQIKTVHVRTVDTKNKMCGPTRLQRDDLAPHSLDLPRNGPRWCAECLRLSDMTPARLDAALRERVRAEIKMRRQSNRLPPHQ